MPVRDGPLKSHDLAGNLVVDIPEVDKAISVDQILLNEDRNENLPSEHLAAKPVQNLADRAGWANKAKVDACSLTTETTTVA